SLMMALIVVTGNFSSFTAFFEANQRRSPATSWYAAAFPFAGRRITGSITPPVLMIDLASSSSNWALNCFRFHGDGSIWSSGISTMAVAAIAGNTGVSFLEDAGVVLMKFAFLSSLRCGSRAAVETLFGVP